MAKIELDKKTRRKVFFRHQFLQGSWNYERMQNLGFLYSITPALKKLYTKEEDAKQAMKRHMEFYNTHPYPSAPVLGVTLALEEDRANGAAIDDATINGVKVGMMGPLAGVGDPIFWATIRPLLGALGASFAMQGNLMGPILFFVLWNILRMAFLYYTQEIAYKQGTALTSNLTGGLLGKLTEGASILGMYVMGVLVARWVSIDLLFPINQTGDVDQATGQFKPDTVKWQTLQEILNSLMPGLVPVLLLFAVLALLNKKVNPLVIIIGLFVVGIIISFLYLTIDPNVVSQIEPLNALLHPNG